MHYIVFDLEFNQSSTPEPDSELRFEILQFGALKLDENFQTLASFQRLVKPTLYHEVSPFIRDLTGIQTEELTDQEQFPKVYEEFLNFISDPDAIYCVWGSSDVKELFRNVEYHKLSYDGLPREYIDIQPYVSEHLGYSHKTLLRLQFAVEALHIEQKYPFHDAFHDAYYTAELLKKVYQASIQSKVYIPQDTPHKSPRQTKKRVDFEGLYGQFEKMYHREISEEEKGIIRLAYHMGKTQQFLVEEPAPEEEAHLEVEET